MILFSEPLLFCKEFPPPAARGGCLVSRKPRLCLPRSGGGARSLRVTGSGEPGAGAPAQVRQHPQVLLAARLTQIPRSAQQALSPRRPAWPFALFYLIGWRGQRILPGEARGVLEMIRFLAVYTCAHTLAHTPTHSCHTRAVHPCIRTLHSDTTPNNTRTRNTIHAHAKYTLDCTHTHHIQEHTFFLTHAPHTPHTRSHTWVRPRHARA